MKLGQGGVLAPCSPPLAGPPDTWERSTYFMHPEYCWQRATGTRTTQRGKAASRAPEAVSSSRLRRRCPVSPLAPDLPHLQEEKAKGCGHIQMMAWLQGAWPLPGAWSHGVWSILGA